MDLSYTDTVTVTDGNPEVVQNGVSFKTGDATKCRIQLKVGDESENYSFLTLVKIMSPSGKPVAWVSGSSGNWDLEFDIEEKGTYTIRSEYYTDAFAFKDACLALDPKHEIKIEEDGSFDGFVFTKNDGLWTVDHDIKITTLK